MMENSPDFLMAEGAMAKLGSDRRADQHQPARRGAGARAAHARRRACVLVDARLLAGGAPSSAPLDGLDGLSPTRPSRRCAARRFRSLPEALAARGDAEPDIPDVKVVDVLLYIYTSGTTGYPKPTIIRHARFTMGGALAARSCSA